MILLGFAGSAAELQRLLSYVKQWAGDVGLALNTGPGKTEAMCVDAGARDIPVGVLQPLQLDDGRVVQWTTQYRYLGYHLRSDLSDEGAVQFLFRTWTTSGTLTSCIMALSAMPVRPSRCSTTAQWYRAAFATSER